MLMHVEADALRTDQTSINEAKWNLKRIDNGKKNL